jgi:creatinine amidohydrolase
MTSPDSRWRGDARRWSDLAWPEIGARYRTQPTDVGLLPVGATEQHGPHLPCGTDTIVATAICDAVSARTGAVVLPALPIGCSYGHGRQLPGTLSLSPEGLASIVRQTIEWAASSGLHRVLLVNAHVGNHPSLLMASDHLRLERPDLRTAVVGWWAADDLVARETAADGDDIHANRSETSLMLAVAPELVHMGRLDASDDPDRTGNLVFRYTATSLSTNGVTGRPSEASAALGRRLFDRTVGALAARVEHGRREEPPLTDHRLQPAGLPDGPASGRATRTPTRASHSATTSAPTGAATRSPTGAATRDPTSAPTGAPTRDPTGASTPGRAP